MLATLFSGRTSDLLRILFCNYEYPPLGGGGGVINALLAKELATRHSVTVLTSRGLGLAAREIVDDVDVIRVPVLARKDAAAASTLSMACYLPMGFLRGIGLLRAQSFDIINTHFVVPTGPVGHGLSLWGRIPNVLTVHGGDLYDPSKSSSPHRHASLRTAIRYLLRKADVVVGQSANTLANVSKYYLSDLPTRLIPLGIERPPQTRASRAELEVPQDAFVMVTVGRLVARKGIDQLIRMMPELEAAHLLIIGDGPLRAELETLANTLGVARRVGFEGFVNENRKHALMMAADLYVSTSQHEGFGLVFLEGMAAGLPVVCYDFGGQTDFLEDGKTGGVIALNDTRAFMDCCKNYMRYDALRAGASEENLRRVESYFIDQCAARYEELFAEVIAAGGRRVSSRSSGSTPTSEKRG